MAAGMTYAEAMAATVLADIIANGVFLQTVGMGMLMGSLQGAIASGGDMNAIMAGAVSGAASSMIFYGVGQALGQFTSGMDPGLAYITKVVAHAGVGCLLGAAGGGDCKSGAASAAVSKAVTPITDSVAQWADNAASVSGTTDAGQLRATVGAIQNAIVGGTASVAAGGKFANGAMNGAFGYLFNELLSRGGSKAQSGYEKSLGNLSFFGAVEHWAYGGGSDIRVPLSSLDLSQINASDFPGGVGSSRVFDLSQLSGTNISDRLVYGNITLTLVSENTVSATLGQDRYNFDMKAWSSETFMRNVATALGQRVNQYAASASQPGQRPVSGTGFYIQLDGTAKLR